MVICPGDILTFDPPKRFGGRLFVKLEVDSVFNPASSIHPGEPRVIGMGTPLRGRKRRPVNVLAAEIGPGAMVSAVHRKVEYEQPE